MLRNQASALLLHERIETTVPKAKELKPFVERIITIAKRSLADTSDPVRGVNARRLVARDIADKAVVTKLFDEIAPRFVERPGGYTRLLRLGHRRGDSADVAQIELVGSEYDPAAESEEKNTEQAKPKGVGGRLRAAAERLRGRKAETTTEGEAGEEGAPKKTRPARDRSAKPSRADTRGKGAKTSTPRKAGGS